jgi:hypothetical protein
MQAQQAGAAQPIAATELATDLTLLHRIQASVAQALTARDNEIARLARQAAQAAQRVAIAEARTAALAEEAARMDARLAEQIDRVRCLCTCTFFSTSGPLAPNFVAYRQLFSLF